MSIYSNYGRDHDQMEAVILRGSNSHFVAGYFRGYPWDKNRKMVTHGDTWLVSYLQKSYTSL